MRWEDKKSVLKADFEAKTGRTLQSVRNFAHKLRQLASGIFRYPLKVGRALRETEAAELLEFALALPLILVMVAGLLDFANAYNVKQRLANAAREGARLGAATPTIGDTSTCQNPVLPVPCSVQAIYSDVVAYLTDAGVNTSFIGTSAQTCTTSRNSLGYCWEYSTSTSSGTYGLMIERQAQILNADSNNTTLPATRVTLTYPYDWTYGFNHIIDLLIPSASVAGTIDITTYAEMANQAS